MPRYDIERFDPPVPLALVTIRNPLTGSASVNVPMLLDSGADVTLIPRAVIDHLAAEATPQRQYELIGFDGTSSLSSAVHLELIFCRRKFRGQLLAIEQPWGILGRNVLNSIAILLDGPHQRWDEQP
jgi:hypothetical protein